MKYRAGALDRSAFARGREAWLIDEQKRAARSGNLRRGLLWVVAYAMNVVTPEDARDALTALPLYAPLPSALDLGIAGAAPIGETYRLAGRDAEARAWLSRASASCQPIEYAMLWVQSSAQLGIANEEAGDTAAACAAYARVLRVWGGAARSTTAADVRRRAAALRCAPPR